MGKMTRDRPDSIPTRYRPPALAIRWALRVMALAACGLAAVLLYQSLGTSGLPGCGPQSGCEQVLSSRWSKWLTLPVAGPGLVLYGVVLSASVYIGPASRRHHQRTAWFIMLAAGVSMVGAAAWFTATQVVDLRIYCKYCLAAHSCAVLLGLLIWFCAPVGRRQLLPNEPADPMMMGMKNLFLVVFVGLLPVGGLVGGQLLFPAPTIRATRVEAPPDTDLLAHSVPLEDFDTGPGPNRTMSILSGRVEMTPYEYPILGSADAPVILVYLFDYTCPHCRKLHGQLQAVRKRYGRQVAITALPVPLNADCNRLIEQTMQQHEAACDLAKIALAVWKARPDLFETFDQWLFLSKKPRNASEARQRAEQLLGKEEFDLAIADPWIGEQIGKDVMLYEFSSKLAGGESLPQLIVGPNIIRGRPKSEQELFKILEEYSTLKPPAP